MSRPQQKVCGRGLHRLDDPRNIGIKTTPAGVGRRFCQPCEAARRREVPLPLVTALPSERQLLLIQARADGLSDEEIAERDGIGVDAVRQGIFRARRKLRVTPTLSAAVAMCLAYELIEPDRNGPLPRKTVENAPYAASVLALVQGRRKPMSAKDVQRRRLLDALYAWSEPHAVSILWASQTLTKRDLYPLFAKTKR
ncbi:RNA polymerase sigma factor [Streptomyces sp. NPDC005244]|uniref:RNA polymerase sigma factor n=1 Tax=Streptomyces sp. NPDC005244 TaxID=3364708 RepID=UPI0036BB935F